MRANRPGALFEKICDRHAVVARPDGATLLQVARHLVHDGSRPGFRALAERGDVGAGAGLVKAQAEAEGLDRVFTAAGFEWPEPGCSMCVGMNGDLVAPGERCAATSNRSPVGQTNGLLSIDIASPPCSGDAQEQPLRVSQVANSFVMIGQAVHGQPAPTMTGDGATCL